MDATASGVARRRTLAPEVGAMLRDARHSAELTGRQAAARAGISRGMLLDVESGRRCPSAAVAEALADVLDLDEAERTALLAAAVPGIGYSRPGRVRTLRPPVR
jgi:transcriptional regulator with XRE-family HTH domain